MAQEEKVEEQRVAAAQKLAKANQVREDARRAAHAEAGKRAYAESVIVHGPVKT